MSKRDRPLGFRQQMHQSMRDLESIIERGESPAGNGRFTARTVEIVDPAIYDAKSIRKARRSLNLSQSLFAQLLGVSGSLVRAWEIGSRQPAPIARRLLDQVCANPLAFRALVRASKPADSPARRPLPVRSRRVA